MKVRKFVDPQEAREYGKEIVAEALKYDYYKYNFNVRFASGATRPSFVIAKTDKEAEKLSNKFCEENWVIFDGFIGERELLERDKDYKLKYLLAFTRDYKFRPDLEVEYLHYFDKK